MTRLCQVAAGCLALLAIASSLCAQDGAALYRQNCAACHDAGVDRAPARDALQTMSAERVLNALENGAMLSMASRMSATDRRAIAQFVTGKSLSARDLSTALPALAMCAAASAFGSPTAAPSWNGWGNNTSNTRFQNAAA